MAQLNILYVLHRSGEMTMSQLAECLNVSMSNATGLIDRMEERGFLERTRVPEDRRVVLVRMTATGAQLLDEHDAMTDDLLRTVLSRLRPDELAGVASATSALRTAIEAIPAPDRHAASIPDSTITAHHPGRGPRPRHPKEGLTHSWKHSRSRPAARRRPSPTTPPSV